MTNLPDRYNEERNPVVLTVEKAANFKETLERAAQMIAPIADDLIATVRELEETRLELAQERSLTARFQVQLADLKEQMDRVESERARLLAENADLSMRLLSIERHVKSISGDRE